MWAYWNPEPSTALGLVALLGGYFLGVGPLRRRYGWADHVGQGQVSSFVLGFLVLFVALLSPLHEIGERYLFAAHMVQYLLLTLVMPPLVLLGTPGWLLRPLLRLPGMFPAARLATYPGTAFGAFTLVFALWHYPLFLESTLRSPALHIAAYLLLMVSALLTWWPIFSPLPEFPRLPLLGQAAYLLAQMVPCSAIGALITLSPTVLYPWYTEAPRLWGLSALADQQIGGVLMWAGGNAFWMVAAVVAFFRWAERHEQAEAARGAASSAPLDP